MMQAIAILLDSLRELRSRSLFWIALVISVLVSVSLFGMIGFSENGWHILWFKTNESLTLRAGSEGARQLVSWLFGGALLWWWLTWGAIVLALITTANTIPEFVSSGGIDLVLSKPIGRVRLYALKMLSAMLFMLLQVTICVAIAYVLAGWRFGMWFHAAWLAVPLVTLQFLYVFAIMSFVGLVTRSALASLLAALMFWGMVSVVQFTTNQLEKITAEARFSIEQADSRIAEIRQRAGDAQREPTPSEHSRIRGYEERRQPMQSMLDAITPWLRPAQRMELIVPKSGDIQKIVAERVDAPTFNELMMYLQGFDPDAMAKLANMADGQQFREAQEASVVGERAARKVNAPVSIGTSLIFTAIVIGLSLFIFARRDF